MNGIAHDSGDRHRGVLTAALFIALLATALALGSALAHVLELPNKMNLSRDDYFVVQTIYSGWNRLGVLLAVELLAMIAVIMLSRNEPRVFWPAVVALICLIVAQVIFWAYTFPANTATDNWTRIPDTWQDLRRTWEYSHAAGAAFQLLALIALIVAALSRGRPSGA